MAVVKEGASYFTSRLCLVWSTEKPYLDRYRESPAFRFMNHDWCLKLVYDQRITPSYDAFIVSKSEIKTFPEFSVSIHFENPRRSETLFHSTKKVSAVSDLLWRANKADLLSKVTDFDDNGDFTLVFVFGATDDAAEIKGQREHRAIQAFFDFPLKSTIHFDQLGESTPTSSSNLPISFSSLSDDLANMLRKKIFPDVQLKSGDLVIPAHRALLAARSRVFAAMFRHDMSESSSGVVNIEDIDKSAVEAFLSYLYSGKITGANLTEDLVSELYAAGDKYAVEALKKTCSEFMIRNANDENFVTYLCLADSHSDVDFKNAILSIVSKNQSWLKSEAWLKFAPKNAQLANEVFCNYFNK